MKKSFWKIRCGPFLVGFETEKLALEWKPPQGFENRQCVMFLAPRTGKEDYFVNEKTK